MATTKIWAVSDNLKRVLEYASNPDKTENRDLNDYQFKGLKNVIEYAADNLKTEKQFYVSGLNCSPNNVLVQMISTKKAAHKEDGVKAFHCYQSFSPGEVTAETAHAIGTELAKRMWGDDFEVLVTTHLDKKHFHNHFVVNSVSWTTHKRFLNKHADYDRFRRLSDELCKEYSLSVIEHPKKGKHYSEWIAEKKRIPTRRSIIKDDVDRAILNSKTFTQFIRNLKEMGYEVKTGVKHMAIKPPGAPRFFRLHNLSKNEDYSEDGIKKRILDNRLFVDGPVQISKKTFRLHGQLRQQKKLKGFRALYFHYMYQMGIIPNHAPKQVHFLLSQELRYMDKITQEATLLCRQKISTLDELETKRSQSEEKLDDLIKKRRCLYNKVRRCQKLEMKTMLQEDIESYSMEIKSLRKEVRLYEGIKDRSLKMKNIIASINETQRDTKISKEYRNGIRQSIK